MNGSLALMRRLRTSTIVFGCFVAAALAAGIGVGVDGVPMMIGGRTGMVLATMFVLGPVLAYVAISRPLILPFALWAGLIPIENLFAVRGASLEKYLGIVAAVAALVHVIVLRRAVAPSRAAIAWLGFLAYAAASLAWSSSAQSTAGAIQMLGGLILTVVVIATVRPQSSDLRWIAVAIMAGGAVSALFAMAGVSHFYQQSVINPRADARIVLDNGVLSTDPNFSAASLLLPVIVGVVGAISLRNVAARLACACAAAGSTLAIVIFASRSGLVSLAAGLLYVFLRSKRRVVLIPVAVLIASMLFVFPQFVLGRFNNSEVSDGDGRFEIWTVGYAAFRHHWAIGNGLGTFQDAYASALMDDAYNPDPSVRESHNSLLQVAVELGVVGVALVAFAGFCQFRELRNIPREAGGWYDLRIACEAATTAVIFDTFTLNLLVWKLTWLCFASAWIVRSAYENRGAAANAADAGPAGLRAENEELPAFA